MADDERPGRVLAIDYGKSRIGIAVSDELGILAHPRPFVPGRPPQRAIRRIAALARAEGVTHLVLGLPLNMDGSEGPSAARVRTFGEELVRVIGLPLDFEDERLSTVEASALLRAAGVRGPEARGKIDSASAAVFLQTWLDAREER